MSKKISKNEVTNLLKIMFSKFNFQFFSIISRIFEKDMKNVDHDVKDHDVFV